MATFKIIDVFNLTNRGSVVMGSILEGNIRSGDYMVIVGESGVRNFLIKSIEGVRALENPSAIGLMLGVLAEEELKNLFRLVGETVLIEG